MKNLVNQKNITINHCFAAFSQTVCFSYKMEVYLIHWSHKILIAMLLTEKNFKTGLFALHLSSSVPSLFSNFNCLISDHFLWKGALKVFNGHTYLQDSGSWYGRDWTVQKSKFSLSIWQLLLTVAVLDKRKYCLHNKYVFKFSINGVLSNWIILSKDLTWILSSDPPNNPRVRLLVSPLSSRFSRWGNSASERLYDSSNM